MTAEGGRAAVDRRDVGTLARGAGITLAGQLGTQVLRMVNSLLMVRLLPVEAFGLITLAIATTQLLLPLGRLGLDIGLMKSIPACRRAGKEGELWSLVRFAWVTVAVVSAVLGLALAVGASWLGTMMHKPDLGPILVILAITVPAGALGATVAGALTGLKAIAQRVLSQQWIPFGSRSLLLLVCLLLGGGLRSVLWIVVVTTLLGTVYGVVVVRRLLAGYGPQPLGQGAARSLLAFSTPLVATAFVVMAVDEAPVLILGAMAGAAEVANFGVVMKIAPLVALPLVALAGIVPPVVAECHASGDMAKLQGVYRLVTRWAITLALPIVITIVLLADPLLLLFGEPYLGARTPLLVLSAGYLVNAAVGHAGQVLLMGGRSKVTVVNALAALGILVGCALLLVPGHGALGAAIAAAVGMTVLNLLRLIEVYHFFGVQPYGRALWRPLLATALGGACAWVLQAAWPLPSIPRALAAAGVFLVIYAAVLLGLGLEEEDRQVVGGIARRLRSRAA